MKQEKWILFDAMGVVYVVGDDTNDLLVPYVQRINPSCSREYINEVYVEATLGKISSDEFFRKMNRNGLSNSNLCEEYLNRSIVIDPDFIKTARKLKEHYHLAMLSNDVSEWSIFLRRKFALEELFDIFIISGDVKLRKPDEKIYEYALQKVKVDAKDCIFIDDRKKNLLPAKTLGMNVIRFAREIDDNPCLENVCEVHSFIELPRKIHELFQ